MRSRESSSGYGNTLPDRHHSARVWYSGGLRFECTECGHCCSGEPGYVYVNEEEIARFAERLGLSVAEFEARFVREIGREKSLMERPNGDCVFLDPISRKCLVYDIRPRQCRSYPFWASHLQSEREWEKVCRACPGCGRGRLYSVEEITRLARLIDI